MVHYLKTTGTAYPLGPVRSSFKSMIRSLFPISLPPAHHHLLSVSPSFSFLSPAQCFNYGLFPVVPRLTYSSRAITSKRRVSLPASINVSSLEGFSWRILSDVTISVVRTTGLTLGLTPLCHQLGKGNSSSQRKVWYQRKRKGCQAIIKQCMFTAKVFW